MEADKERNSLYLPCYFLRGTITSVTPENFLFLVVYFLKITVTSWGYLPHSFFIWYRPSSFSCPFLQTRSCLSVFLTDIGLLISVGLSCFSRRKAYSPVGKSLSCLLLPTCSFPTSGPNILAGSSVFAWLLVVWHRLLASTTHTTKNWTLLRIILHLRPQHAILHTITGCFLCKLAMQHHDLCVSE